MYTLLLLKWKLFFFYVVEKKGVEGREEGRNRRGNVCEN